MYATTSMNFKIIVLRESGQTQRLPIVLFHLCEVAIEMERVCIAKSIEIE